MSAEHLTDQDIQLFLDGLIPELDEKINHLAGCTQCQMQVKIYKTIYQVSSEAFTEIDPTLADRVMSRIIEQAPVKTVITADRIVFAGMICCFLITLFLFGNNAGSILWDFVNLVSKGNYAKIFVTLFFAGILLVIIQLLDSRLIKNYYANKELI